MQKLENNYNVHDSGRQKYYIYNDSVQFCDRFSDIDESQTNNSDSDNSAYEPKSAWKVSYYIVCIDNVGIFKDKAI